MESYFEITIQKTWFGLIIAVFFNILLITRLDSIDINHSKWKTSSITTFSIEEIIFFKTWFVAKYDSVKNNKNHGSSSYLDQTITIKNLT